MSIKKQYLKSKPQVKVTFEIEKQDAQDADNISLLSEHNNWVAIELKKFKNGKFKIAENISTEERESFQFIYKATAADGREFTILPDDADGYVHNGITDDGRNAVLQISL
ncbi:hypothetical protein [Psychromonas ossibalaenae]|uniref:hypothetical protein n=1 Tax=Psychromonas ossibalaenae TaxID=444922 RepID=UPI00036EE25C|nr:hypothetical protein [Psychromonas ossibalaenae]